jgi:carboxymethylenebutenolidase
MNKHIIPILLLVIFFSYAPFTNAQHSCCSTNAFALLTHDKAFVNAHLEPEYFVLETKLGSDIEFTTPDGKKGHAYEIKAKSPSKKYVFVIHEWWGLNDYIKQESEKIFNALGNVNVIAIDLYDYQVATSRDSAAKYMQSVQTNRAESIIKGAISYAGDKAQIATVGWCFGGGWSMQASLLAAKQNVACVMYYGMPEEKLEKLKTLNAPVLFVWPVEDKWINQEMVDRFKKNMTAASKKLEVLSYHADHAFANPSNPKHNKEFAADAFSKSMKLMIDAFAK